MLQPSSPRLYERILAIGGPSAGKTSMWLNIAKWHQTTGSDAKFYVIDTDYAVERMLSGTYSGLTNVHHDTASDWEEITSLIDQYTNKVRVQDWLVYDMYSTAWSEAQSYYSEQKFGKDLADHFLQFAQSAKKGNEFEGDTDWKVINTLYNKKVAHKILRAQCHVFATAQAKATTDRDSKQVKQLFARFGVKPEGQKDTGHMFHTVLKVDDTPDGRRVTSIKDREREMLEGEVMPDFTMGYLRKVAGWTL